MIITKRSFVWHDMNIKYIWHEYQSTTKIIIITTRLLVWLASSFFCCWLALQAPGFGLAGGLGFRFFHQQFFPYASLWKKKIRFTSKYKFESSQAPERPALSWAAGDEQVFSEQRPSLMIVDKFDHVAPSYGNEFLARGNMAHRTLPKVISILLLDCLLAIWS